MIDLSSVFPNGSGGSGTQPPGPPSLIGIYTSSASLYARRTGWYRITGVAAGGSGGAAAGVSTTSAKATGGGPGAFLKEYFYLQAGDPIVIQIGAPGAGVQANSAGTVAVATDGNSAANTKIILAGQEIILEGGRGGSASVANADFLNGGLAGSVQGLTTPFSGKGSDGGAIISTGWTSGQVAAATGGGAPDILTYGPESTRMKVGRIIINGAANGAAATGGGSIGGGSEDIFTDNANTLRVTGSGGAGGKGDANGTGGGDAFGGTSNPAVIPSMYEDVRAAPFAVFSAASNSSTTSTVPGIPNNNNAGAAAGAWAFTANAGSVSMSGNYGSGPFASLGGQALIGTNTATAVNIQTSVAHQTGYGAGGNGAAARKSNTGSQTVIASTRDGGRAVVVVEEC